jgi:hypothetical protein
LNLIIYADEKLGFHVYEYGFERVWARLGVIGKY